MLREEVFGCDCLQQTVSSKIAEVITGRTFCNRKVNFALPGVEVTFSLQYFSGLKRTFISVTSGMGRSIIQNCVIARA